MAGSDVQWQFDGTHDELERAVSGADMSTVFQPIVSLPTGTTVGFEALTRWPRQPNLGPQSVFAYAEKTNRVTELDTVCIERAIDGALRGGLPKGALLGVNSEPGSDYTSRADSVTLQRGHDRFALVVELTERNLLDHLPTLLRKVAALRADGIAIALDDVGANPESLALLDIVHPEVIKLAMPLIQAPQSIESARIGAAIMAHRERCATLIIAEGIETEEHHEQALAWGATMGQGFLFGRPAPLPSDTHAVTWSPPDMPTGASSSYGSPFDVVATDPGVRTASKQMLAALSRHLEEQAGAALDTPMVLSSFQHAGHFAQPTRDRYTALAQACPLVAVFGRDVVPAQSSSLRTVDVDPSDPLCRQWVVVTLGPHTAAAVIARERESDTTQAEDDRRFDFVVTHDRAVITAAATTLLDRVP